MTATPPPTVTAGGGDPSLAGCGCGCGCGDGTTSTGSTAAATMPGRLTWVGVNATRAVQAVAVRQESLGLAPGTPYHVCTLAHSPVLTTALPAATAEAVTVEVQDIDGTWSTWRQIDDILAAGPRGPGLRPRPGRRDHHLRLGPATGCAPCAGRGSGRRYWYGGGAQGQVAIGGINKSTALPGGFTVTNPLPTWGAGDGESSADGEAAITRWLRHRDRLVTSRRLPRPDPSYARDRPGPGRGAAAVQPRRAPATQEWPGMVTVLVIPRRTRCTRTRPSPTASSSTRSAPGSLLAGWSPPSCTCAVRSTCRCGSRSAVVPLPGQVPSLVNQAVTNAVRSFLSPLTGGLPSEPSDDGLVGTRAPRARAGRSGWACAPRTSRRWPPGCRACATSTRCSWPRSAPTARVVSPVDTRAAHRPAAAAGDRLLQRSAGCRPGRTASPAARPSRRPRCPFPSSRRPADGRPGLAVPPPPRPGRLGRLHRPGVRRDAGRAVAGGRRTGEHARPRPGSTTTTAGCSGCAVTLRCSGAPGEPTHSIPRCAAVPTSTPIGTEYWIDEDRRGIRRRGARAAQPVAWWSVDDLAGRPARATRPTRGRRLR